MDSCESLICESWIGQGGGALKHINNAYYEFMIAKELKHPFIAEYKYFIHEYHQEAETPRAAQNEKQEEGPKDKYMTHLMLEYLGGKDLNHYIITRCKELSETQRLYQTKLFGGQIIHALAFLFENKIVHRDLKPQNIVLT